MQQQRISVSGWAFNGVVCPDEIFDILTNNDHIVAYLRLSTPSVQQRIEANNLSLAEIAALCHQSPKTFGLSLDKLVEFHLLTISDSMPSGRGRPRKQITVLSFNPQAIPAPTEKPTRKKAVRETVEIVPDNKIDYTDEWMKPAPKTVLTLIDDLQGGKPDNITNEHYGPELASAKKIAKLYPPEYVIARWKEIKQQKPQSWVSARWVFQRLPRAQFTGGKIHDAASKGTFNHGDRADQPSLFGQRADPFEQNLATAFKERNG